MMKFSIPTAPLPPAVGKVLSSASAQNEPGWKPLILPAAFINESALIYKDGDLAVCILSRNLASGAPVMEIGTSTPADNELTSYILQQQDADHYIEIKQPILLRNIADSSKQLIYKNRSFRQRPIAATKGYVWERTPSGKLASSDPLVVGLDRRFKDPIYQIPDGTVLGVNEFNPVIDVVYQNMPYAFHPQTRFQDGWYYSARKYIESAIRFRPRADGSYKESAFPEQHLDSQGNPALFKAGDTYEVEPFSPETNLFPLHSPVHLRDEDGRIWETLADDPDAGLFIARHYLHWRLGDEEPPPEYSAFEVNQGRLVRMDLEDSAHILGLRTYTDPESTWLNLEKYSASKIILPTTFNRVSVDIANLVTDESMPRFIRRFKEYAADFDGHVIKVRIGKRYSSGDLLLELLRPKDIDLLYNILPTIPKALLRGVHTITVVDTTKADPLRLGREAAGGTYIRGGHVTLIRPHYLRGANMRGHKKTATQIILHESSHFFTSDTHPAFRRRLEAAVALANQMDGKAGYRDYAETSWTESLAVGFEAFEKAGPAMQQLILNLMLNPDWQP